MYVIIFVCSFSRNTYVVCLGFFFAVPFHLSEDKMCQLGSLLCHSVCVCVASASLAAGISQSRDRTCCLSGRRVAIVTLSASLRCFWETIPHPNQPVCVPATGHSSPFFPLSAATLFISFPVFCLFFPSSSL